MDRIKSTEDYFYASLQDWSAQASAIANAVRLVQGTVPHNEGQPGAMLAGPIQDMHNLAREIDLARTDVEVVTNVLQMRKTEAEARGAVIQNWPDDTVSKQLMYVGAILFGAGGVSTAVGTLLGGIDRTIFPLVVALGGVVAFLYGLAGLAWDQRRKWTFFSTRFRLGLKGDPTRALPDTPALRPW